MPQGSAHQTGVSRVSRRAKARARRREKGRGDKKGDDKGKGKGYQGSRYKRGKTGHKAWESKSSASWNVSAVREEILNQGNTCTYRGSYQDAKNDEPSGEVDVGTAWRVGHVESVGVMAAIEEQATGSRFNITLDSGAGVGY